MDMYTGTVIFMLCNEGSKSEGLFPFLYQGEGRLVPLRKEGDNPFEHGSFRPFDGKEVWLSGDMGEDLTLTVTQILKSPSLADQSQKPEEDK